MPTVASKIVPGGDFMAVDADKVAETDDAKVFTAGEREKVGHLSVTQAIDLDAVPGQIATAGTITLADVAGTGAAYTATAPAGTRASGKFVLFTPHVDSTVTLPTLNLGDGAFNIASEIGTASAAGRFKAGVPVVLRFVSGAWRVVQSVSGTSVAENVAGTGAAYTATAPDVTLTAGRMLLFTPHVTSTTTVPTLDLGTGALAIVSAAGNALEVGRLRAGAPVLLRFLSNAWRLASPREMTTVSLNSVGGTGSAYTATTAEAPVIAEGTMISFRPHVTNTDKATISIDGGAAIPILSEGFSQLEAGQLVRLAQYWGYYRGNNLQLIGVPSPTRPGLHTARNIALANETHRRRSALASPLASGGAETTPIILDGTTRTYWIASSGDGQRTIRVTGGTCYIDLRHISVGSARPVTIDVAGSATAKLIADDGGTGDIRTVAGVAFVQVWRPANTSYRYQAVSGSVTDGGETHTSVPACDLHINVGGQSLGEYFVKGSGLYGLQYGLESLAGDKSSIWVSEGATGGSGLLSIDGGAKYWWDHTTDGPGPMATDWLANLNAQPAAQGDPDVIYWVFDQNLAAYLGTHAELSLANAKAHYQALFAWMRAQIGATTPIVISPLGAAYTNTTDAQQSAARWLVLEIIAEDANTHLGPPYFDLPRAYQDVHMGPAGQMLQGYRLAAVLDNVLNGATHGTGPVVTGIAEEDGGRRYAISITYDTRFHTQPKFFDGIAVLPAGTTPLNGTPVQQEYGYWLTAGAVATYYLVLAEQSPGATIVWPWGDCSALMAGNYVRDAIADGVGNYWPLRPFKSGAF